VCCGLLVCPSLLLKRSPALDLPPTTSLVFLTACLTRLLWEESLDPQRKVLLSRFSVSEDLSSIHEFHPGCSSTPQERLARASSLTTIFFNMLLVSRTLTLPLHSCGFIPGSGAQRELIPPPEHGFLPPLGIIFPPSIFFHYI